MRPQDAPDAEHRDEPPQAESGSTISPQRLSLAGAGVELGLVVAVMTLGGWWLDQWLANRNPWCMIVGAGIAIVGGLYKFWLRASRAFDRPREKSSK